MKPIKFKECNAIAGEDSYSDLPVFKDPTNSYGDSVSCWKLTFRERLKILFTGKVWLLLRNFGEPVTPSLLTTNKEDVITYKKGGLV